MFAEYYIWSAIIILNNGLCGNTQRKSWLGGIENYAEVIRRVKERTCKYSLAYSSASQPLNKEATLSVASKVLSDNHSEENQRQHTDGPKVLVYVLNKNGKPLMPCKPTKARHLLEQNRAKAVSRKPFTIQLLWTCEHKTQPVKLGMDPGYQKVGVSAASNKKNCYRLKYNWGPTCLKNYKKKQCIEETVGYIMASTAKI